MAPDEGIALSVPNDADREVYGALAAHAFAFPPEGAPAWFAQAGHDNLRISRVEGRVEGRVAAGLVEIPMGQFFGGRSVPMVGMAGVVVAPEARGSGLATRVMCAEIRALHARGVALSALYPATVPLYRRAGYERAGVYAEIRVAPALADTGVRDLAIEPTHEEDAEVHALYRAFAAERPGFLDRGPYVWSRVFRPRGVPPCRILKVIGARGAEGYVVLTQKSEGSLDSTTVVVTDLVARTGRAAERLLALLADYGSIATTIAWHGAVPDLFTFLLRDRRHAIREDEHWMLRVVDVERALASRGWPRVLRGIELGLEIDDDVVPANAGRWSLRVDEGRATIGRGGDGALRLHVRALAALYSGYLPARALVAAGVADGDASAIERAEALFAGPAPACSNFF